MKKIIFFCLVTIFVTSCASSKGGHCDAYSSKKSNIKTSKKNKNYSTQTAHW